MKLFLSTLVILTALCPIASSAKVNKCKVNGKTVYQQQPCDDESQNQALSPSVKLMGGKRKNRAPEYEKALKKYKKPLNTTGNKQTDLAMIKGLADLANNKAIDCQVEIKVYGVRNDCADFLAYITEGSKYNQALVALDEISKDKNFINKNRFDFDSIIQNMKKVVEVKTMLVTSVAQ